jgi:exonuclease III
MKQDTESCQQGVDPDASISGGLPRLIMLLFMIHGVLVSRSGVMQYGYGHNHIHVQWVLIMFLFMIPGAQATLVGSAAAAALLSRGWVASTLPFVVGRVPKDSEEGKDTEDKKDAQSREEEERNRREGLSILSWNVNGIHRLIRTKEKARALKEFIREHDPDVIMLQETHLDDGGTDEHEVIAFFANLGFIASPNSIDKGETARIIRETVNRELKAHGRAQRVVERKETRTQYLRAGTMILRKHSLPITVTNVSCYKGYLQSMEFDWEEEKWNVGNVYAYNQPGERRDQAGWMMKSCRSPQAIWVGDFNEHDTDPNSKCPLRVTMNQKGFTEMLQLWDPEERMATRTSCMKNPAGATICSRPDKVYVSNDLASTVRLVTVLDKVHLSDHFPVMVELKRGPSARQAQTNPRREYLVRPTRKANESQWERDNNRLRMELQQMNGQTDVESFWKALLKTLEIVFPMEERTVRNKDQGAEIPSLMLHAEEAQQGAFLRRNRNWLNISTRRVLPSGISSKQEAEKFYSKLYSEPSRASKEAWEELTREIVRPIPSRSEIDILEKPITAQEVQEVIGRLKQGVTPGYDGITSEVFQHLSADNIQVLAEAMNNQFSEARNLPEHWCRVVIPPLWKDGNPEYWANYRPISLLCTDYKIYAEILASRAQQVQLYSDLQAGFLENQGTVQHIKTLLAILSNMKSHKTQGAVLFVDFQKAFDTVPWEVIRWAGEIHNLPPTFFNAMMKLYSQPTEARIETAMGLTDPIQICQGVRQGCPFSPLVFDLVVDCLLRAVQAKETGYYWGHTHTPALAYADDIALISPTTERMRQGYRILLNFCEATRMRLNPPKCAVLSYDNDPPRLMFDGREIPVMGPDSHYKYLGLWIRQDLNWEKQLSLLRKRVLSVLHLLRGHKATPMGKAMLVNTFALSLLNYHMQILVLPENLLKELQKMACETVKAGSLSGRFPDKLIQLPKKNGGLGLWNLAHRQRILFMNASLDKFLNARNWHTREIARTQMAEGLANGRVVRTEKGRLIPMGLPPLKTAGSSPCMMLHICRAEGVNLMLPWPNPSPLQNERDIPRGEVIFSDGGKTSDHLSMAWACPSAPMQTTAVRLPSTIPSIYWTELLAVASGVSMDMHPQWWFIDSQSTCKAVQAYREGPRKMQRKYPHNILLKAAEEVCDGKLKWIPAHTTDSRRRLVAGEENLRQTSAMTGLPLEMLQRGNAMADHATHLTGQRVISLSSEELRDHIRALAPDYFTIEAEGWGAISSPIKEMIGQKHRKKALEDMKAMPAWGELWRRGSKIYWKATRFAWQALHPAKRAFTAFAYNGLLNLVNTPANTSHWDHHATEEAWKAHLSDPLCHFCEGTPKANLEHILLECRETEPFRAERDNMIQMMMERVATHRDGSAFAPDMEMIKSWLKGELVEEWLGAGSMKTWACLGVIPKTLSARLRTWGARTQDIFSICGTLSQIVLFWAQAAYHYYRTKREETMEAKGPRTKRIREQCGGERLADVHSNIPGMGDWDMKRIRISAPAPAVDAQEEEFQTPRRKRGRPHKVAAPCVGATLEHWFTPVSNRFQELQENQPVEAQTEERAQPRVKRGRFKNKGSAPWSGKLRGRPKGAKDKNPKGRKKRHHQPDIAGPLTERERRRVVEETDEQCQRIVDMPPEVEDESETEEQPLIRHQRSPIAGESRPIEEELEPDEQPLMRHQRSPVAGKNKLLSSRTSSPSPAPSPPPTSPTSSPTPPQPPLEDREYPSPRTLSRKRTLEAGNGDPRGEKRRRKDWKGKGRAWRPEQGQGVT